MRKIGTFQSRERSWKTSSSRSSDPRAAGEGTGKHEAAAGGTGRRGAGGGEAEHAFYLWEERDRFEFVGLADASAAVRNALGARYGIQELHPDLPSLLKATKLDALVIAAPDPFHPELAVLALEAGLARALREAANRSHLSGCDRIKAARDKAGQGPAGRLYEAARSRAIKKALDLLPNKIEDVKLISVEVNDPDQNPFVAHMPMTLADDIPAAPGRPV